MIRSRLTILASALLACSTATSAQLGADVASKAYRLQFENTWVKVTRVHYEPRERLPEHQHPGGPNIYVYLNDGGPVLFKHEHGDSGEMAAVRPPTKARAYRLAAARQETHIVENRSDLPSDFLEVGLKTDINLKTFVGRRESAFGDSAANARNVEFDTDQIRVTRITCAAAIGCEPLTAAYPTLWIALSAIDFEGVAGSSPVSGPAGHTQWLDTGATARYKNRGSSPAEYLLVELKSRHTGRADR
jgi:hypothetical protein